MKTVGACAVLTALRIARNTGNAARLLREIVSASNSLLIVEQFVGLTQIHFHQRVVDAREDCLLSQSPPGMPFDLHLIWGFSSSLRSWYLRNAVQSTFSCGRIGAYSV